MMDIPSKKQPRVKRGAKYKTVHGSRLEAREEWCARLRNHFAVGTNAQSARQVICNVLRNY